MKYGMKWDQVSNFESRGIVAVPISIFDISLQRKASSLKVHQNINILRVDFILCRNITDAWCGWFSRLKKSHSSKTWIRFVMCINSRVHRPWRTFNRFLPDMCSVDKVVSNFILLLERFWLFFNFRVFV